MEGLSCVAGVSSLSGQDVDNRTPKRTSARQTKAATSEPLSLDAVLTAALQLPRDQRQALVLALTQYEDVEVVEEPSLDAAPTPRGKLSKGRSARVEVKLIRGCGPYYYYRWWCGKVYRSTYLGKTPPR